MVEQWNVLDGDAVEGSGAAAEINRGLASGEREFWFDSESGRSISLVTNGERAMLMVLAEPGDEGEHAIDPAASSGRSGGYLLSNGQEDSYPDRDTIPLPSALDAVRVLTDEGQKPPDVIWHADRDDGQ